MLELPNEGFFRGIPEGPGNTEIIDSELQGLGPIADRLYNMDIYSVWRSGHFKGLG